MCSCLFVVVFVCLCVCWVACLRFMVFGVRLFPWLFAVVCLIVCDVVFVCLFVWSVRLVIRFVCVFD